MLIIAADYAGHDLSVSAKLLLLVGALPFSILTYGAFENPIRRARWSPPATALGLCAKGIVVLVAAKSLSSIYSGTAAGGSGSDSQFPERREWRPGIQRGNCGSKGR